VAEEYSTVSLDRLVERKAGGPLAPSAGSLSFTLSLVWKELPVRED
jgi:hypothetical protein